SATVALTLLHFSYLTTHSLCRSFFFFFFNAPAPTQIYTLSLHDALPISQRFENALAVQSRGLRDRTSVSPLSSVLEGFMIHRLRSEEHTSELQSPYDLVCRLLLEKKKKKQIHKNNKLIQH